MVSSKFKILGLGALLIIGLAGLAVSSPIPGYIAKLAHRAPAESVPIEIIRSDYASGEVTRLCKAAMDTCSRALDAIAQIDPKDRNFDNTVLAFEKATTELRNATDPLTFMNYVSTREDIKQEGAECEEQIARFGVEVVTRKDLYAAISAPTNVPRGVGEKRLLKLTLLDFERNGLKLPDRDLARVKALKQKLASLETQFSTHLNNDQSVVEFSAEELKGALDDFLSRLKKTESGKYIVTTKDTDLTEVLQNVVSGETRRKMLFAYYNRAVNTNVKLLEEALALREEIAAIMGFKTWADYQTDAKMAKNGEAVLTFLNGLKDKLKQRAQEDLARLAQFKKELDPSGGNSLKAWDINYLSYQYRKKYLSIDEEIVREYFPAERVIEGLFRTYSKLFGVEFVEVKGAKVWFPDVKLFEIRDAISKSVIAYFYADFFPRPGKYNHAAAFTLNVGHQAPDGYAKPVSAIVANFNPPLGDKPSLLSHDEVETVFHEFGHIMHQTLTRAPYASLAGSGVFRDFVEAPSQMLENWAWDPEILTSLSGHYKDSSKKLPKDLLQKMIDAKDFNQGYFYTRQLMLGLVDMTYHTRKGRPDRIDTTAIYDKLYRDLIGVEPVEGGHFQASWGHLMGGYDAGYYGYLWSEVYATDMFSRFESGGLLNSELGMRYRQVILEKGNMAEPTDLLREFLGREPNAEAFYRKLHIGK